MAGPVNLKSIPNDDWANEGYSHDDAAGQPSR
jgi:hypothetical protein